HIITTVGDWLVATSHKVLSLDPNGIGHAAFRGWFDFLGELTAAEKRHGRAFVANAAKALGEGLVRVENHHQPTFDNGGRDFIVALILFVWLTAPKEKRTLVYVRHLLCCGLPTNDPKDDAFHALLFEMIHLEIDDGCGGQL